MSLHSVNIHVTLIAPYCSVCVVDVDTFVSVNEALQITFTAVGLVSFTISTQVGN